MRRTWRGVGPALGLALIASAVAGAPAQAAAGTNTLQVGESLSAGQQLVSANKQYTASISGGDLLVFRAGYGEQYRSRQAVSQPGTRLVLQNTGDLVLLTDQLKPRWNTGTSGAKPGKLVLGNDGNLVYTSSTGALLWSSGTATAQNSTLGELPSGAALTSPNGKVTATMQRDGNLVVQVNGVPTWNSGTAGNPGARAVPSNSGLFVMSIGNRPLWSANTPGSGTPKLAIGDDGILTLTIGGVVKWQGVPTAPATPTSTVIKPNCSNVTGPVPIGDTALASDGARLHTCLIPAYNQMVKDAAAEGVKLTGGGWRDHQRQIELRIQNCGGNTYYNIWEKPSSQCQPPTAIPGRSLHERGLAIDFHVNGRSVASTDPQFAWLSRNAAKYGLYNLPSESWHWSTTGG